MFLVLSSFSAFSHAEKLKVMVWPKISYNQINGWRLGSNFLFNHLWGEDTLAVYGDYSLGDKTAHLGYAYKYVHNSTQFYTIGDADFLKEGVFDGKSLWQWEKSLCLGVSQAVSDHGNLYWFDMKFKYYSFTPYQRLEDVPFERGKDLTFASQAFGYNKGYTWADNLTIGIPTSISDFKYMKEQLLVKKVFDLGSKDRITLAGQFGFISGTYPTLQQFYLGNSDYSIWPDFARIKKTVGKVVNDQVVLPKVELTGYISNAFYGGNSYVGKIEYQHKVCSFNLNSVPFACFGKAYVVTGNAWNGDLLDGFQQTHPAIGLGVNIEAPEIKGLTDQHEWYVGLNLAKGVGEKSVLTWGFDIGLNFDIFQPIFQNAASGDLR